MQLLIVHDDAEVGEQLAGMVADYTEHALEHVASDAAAQQWAQKHARCDLLLAQLDGAGVDGLSLGGTLSEIFPGLQVLFLPGYPARDQRLAIAQTKVFRNRSMANGSSKRSKRRRRRSRARRTCFTCSTSSKCVA